MHAFAVRKLYMQVSYLRARPPAFMANNEG